MGKGGQPEAGPAPSDSGKQVKVIEAVGARPEREGPISDQLRAFEAAEDIEQPPDITPEEAPAEEEYEPEEEPIEPIETEEEAEAEATEGPEEEEPEEKEAEPGDEDFVTIEWPEALKEQGIEDFDVPKEDEDRFRALTNDYKGRREIEAQTKDMDRREERMQDDWSEAAAIAHATPTTFCSDVLKMRPEEILEDFKLYLLHNERTRSDLTEWMNEVLGDDREAGIQARELERAREDRFRYMRDHKRQEYEIRQATHRADEVILSLAETVPDSLRDRITNAMRRELAEEGRRRQAKGDNKPIGPEEVERVVGFMVQPYQGTETTQPRATEKEVEPEKQVEQTQRRLRGRLDRRRGARMATPSGALAKGGPKRGETLDQVLTKLKKM